MKNLFTFLFITISPAAFGQIEQSQPFKHLCFYFEHEQLDSCITLLNNYIKSHHKNFTYDYMEETAGNLGSEFEKLNCGIVYWKKGHYVDEETFKPLSTEEQSKRLRKSKSIILDDFILKINNLDTLIYNIRYSVSNKTKVVSLTQVKKIEWK